MTALQWIVKEAKEIKKKYPKRFSKWTEYVAQASAIYASKHKGKSPVGKKKPSIIKKAASKVKKLVKKAKDAYYEGYNEAARKSNPLMVKKRKVGAVPKKKAAPKKVAKKAAPKKSVSLHKDTKSHNVNIRVMSGIETVSINNVKYLFEQIRKAEGQFQILKDRKKKDKKLVGFDAKLFQRYPGYIKSLKKQLTEAKKNIK